MKLIKFVCTVFLCLLYYQYCSAQSDSVRLNIDSIKTISKIGFDKLVDTSIILLQTKRLSDISDSGHIYIMMCLNTILMTIENHKRKFEGARYNKLKAITEEKMYVKDILKIYPQYVLDRGLGYYFLKLKMELYGTPHLFAWYQVE